MGQEGAWTSDVNFDDVRVGHDTLIGGSEDIGYRAAMTSLARGRIHIAALAVGSRAARARRVGGLRRDRHPGRHADRHFPTGAGDARRPADRRDGRPRAGPRRRAECGCTDEDRRIAPSAAKLFCTEMAGKVADLAVQVHGGAGYMREVPVERIYRDVRLLRLYEGTSEIQRLIIGGGLVKASAAQPVSGRLAGKVAFITGAARGQGRAHAVRMANEGADIIAVDIAGKLPDCVPYNPATPEDLAETVALVEATGRRIVSAIVDTRDYDGLKEAVAHGVATLGRLDIIVANAGVSAPAAWDAITPEAFRDVIDINVTGVWNTVMAGAPTIIDGGRGGSIILISSAAGIKMQPFMVHYTASKHAVTGMARAFAAELGKHSIRVNSVHPGPVATDMGTGDMVAALGKAMETNPALNNMLTPFLPT